MIGYRSTKREKEKRGEEEVLLVVQVKYLLVFEII